VEEKDDAENSPQIKKVKSCRRRRTSSEEPTEQQLERDFHALMRGTKDGTIAVSKESDQIIRVEKVVIDNTQKKPRGGMKVVDRISEE